MITKTVYFVKKFFFDFKKIVFYSKNYEKVINQFYNKVAQKSESLEIPYETALNEELENRDNFFEDKNFPPLFKLVGSFATKDFGKIMSDIDIGQSPNFKNIRMLYRLQEIINRTNPATKDKNMPFYFVRFYLGTIKGYEPQWKYNQQGNCEFDSGEIENWLIKIKTLLVGHNEQEIWLFSHRTLPLGL